MRIVNIAWWDTKRIDDVLELDEVVGNSGWVESLHTLWIKTMTLALNRVDPCVW